MRVGSSSNSTKVSGRSLQATPSKARAPGSAVRAGGSHRALAWIIAFASQAAINMLWPLSYLLKRR